MCVAKVSKYGLLVALDTEGVFIMMISFQNYRALV